MKPISSLTAFHISAKTEHASITYIAIAKSAAEAIMAAVDRFGLAKICASPIRVSHHSSLSATKQLSTPRGACAGAELIAYENPKHAL